VIEPQSQYTYLLNHRDREEGRKREETQTKSKRTIPSVIHNDKAGGIRKSGGDVNLAVFIGKAAKPRVKGRWYLSTWFQSDGER